MHVLSIFGNMVMVCLFILRGIKQEFFGFHLVSQQEKYRKRKGKLKKTKLSFFSVVVVVVAVVAVVEIGVHGNVFCRFFFSFSVGLF